MKLQETDPVRLKEILIKEGGTSKTAVIVLLVILLAATVVAVATDEGAGDLFATASSVVPECNDRAALKQTAKALESGPMSKAIAIKVHEIESIEEIFFDEVKNKRECKGTAFMNSGRRTIKYTFSGRENGEYWVEVLAF